MLDRSLGVYQYHLESEADNPSKRNNQNIERQPLTWCARMHRLACKTLCFSKSIHMPDIVMGLFDNRSDGQTATDSRYTHDRASARGGNHCSYYAADLCPGTRCPRCLSRSGGSGGNVQPNDDRQSCGGECDRDVWVRSGAYDAPPTRAICPR